LNISFRTSQKINGAPASWQTKEKGLLYEYLSCTGPNDELLAFWWSPQSDWQAVNNTPVIRRTIKGTFSAWKTKDSQYDYDHLACRDLDDRLQVFWHSTKWDMPWSILVATLKNQAPNTPADPATPLNLFYLFFTSQGISTYNAVRYFNHMSHRNVDLSKSRLIFVNIDAQLSDFLPPTDPAPSGWVQKYDEYGMLELARQAAKNKGENLDCFVADVLTATVAAFPTHGGVAHSNVTNSTRGYTFGDHRYVQVNGTQSFGHEMGHGFGLDHSRADDPNINIVGCENDTLDYRDPWDKMSTACDYYGPDKNFTWRGPGFNAWNMRGRGWLDESRVWKMQGSNFNQTIDLRPLHRLDLDGWLAAELPPLDSNGHGRFLVEFRLKDEWDENIPRSAVMVHRFSGNQSYIMSGTNGNLDLVTGDSCAPWIDGKTHPSVQVLNIDEPNQKATIMLAYDHQSE
jgi:hypothetical protein